MLKKMLVSVMVLTLALPTTVLAGWEKNDVGWWYTHADGSYTKNNWEQIDGKYYYFNADGYMLHDTQTPDGYWVGADGAWAENIVSTQNAATGPAKETIQSPISGNVSGSNNNSTSVTDWSNRYGTYNSGTHKTKSSYSTKKQSTSSSKSSSKKKDNRSKYEKIYDTYKEKIEKSEGDIQDYANLCVAGVTKMAEVSLKNKLKDYKTYEKWATKLYKVYEKKSMKEFGEVTVSLEDYLGMYDVEQEKDLTE